MYVLQCPRQVNTLPYLPPGYYAAQSSCTADNLLRSTPVGTEKEVVGNGLGAVQPSAFNCKALPFCQVIMSCVYE